MRVVVEVYGTLRRFLPNGQRRIELEMEDAATVLDVLATLGVDLNEPWNASLNGTLADPSDTVPDGSLILLFPAISGG